MDQEWIHPYPKLPPPPPSSVVTFYISSVWLFDCLIRFFSLTGILTIPTTLPEIRKLYNIHLLKHIISRGFRWLMIESSCWPSPCCSFARHLVGKIVIHCSSAHHYAQPCKKNSPCPERQWFVSAAWCPSMAWYNHSNPPRFQRPSATRMFLLLLFLCNGDLLTNMGLGEIKNRRHGEWKNETWNIRWYSCFMSTYCIYLYFRIRSHANQRININVLVQRYLNLRLYSMPGLYVNIIMMKWHQYMRFHQSAELLIFPWISFCWIWHRPTWTFEPSMAKAHNPHPSRRECHDCRPHAPLPSLNIAQRFSGEKPTHAACHKKSPPQLLYRTPLSSPLFPTHLHSPPTDSFPLPTTIPTIQFSPVAGSPHSLAFCFKVRCLHVIPPSQLFEHPWPKPKNIWGTTSGPLLRDLRKTSGFTMELWVYHGVLCWVSGKVQTERQFVKPPKK